jgi:hypothetical protein
MEIENLKRIVCKIANVARREIKLSVLLALIVIVGCRKNNELPSSSVSVINAVVSNGNNYNEKIAVVKLLVNAESIYDPDRQVTIWQGVEVAKGDYRNGGFMINLRDDIDNIKPFDLELPTEAKMSNKNVMYANSRLSPLRKVTFPIRPLKIVFRDMVTKPSGLGYYIYSFDGIYQTAEKKLQIHPFIFYLCTKTG